jgi:hypothetical protein
MVNTLISVPVLISYLLNLILQFDLCNSDNTLLLGTPFKWDIPTSSLILKK